MSILLIKDDAILGTTVRDHVVADNHSVDWVAHLDAANDHLGSVGYDLILLDMMLPDGQAITFLRGLRRKSCVTPVVIVTALDQISGRMQELNAGRTTI